MAGSWRGKKPLQRNAIIALANYRDKTAVPLLLRVMKEDMRPVMKGTAAWAVAEIVNESNEEMIQYFNEQKAAAMKKLESLENPSKEDIELIEELDKAIVVLQEKYREEATK